MVGMWHMGMLGAVARHKLVGEQVQREQAALAADAHSRIVATWPVCGPGGGAVTDWDLMETIWHHI